MWFLKILLERIIFASECEIIRNLWIFFKKFWSYGLSAVNYRKIDKFDQFKKKKDQGNFWRSFFLNYIIHVISKVEKLLLPGILDQIELKKKRIYFLLFSTMPDYTAILVCNLFPISYENDFSK